MVAFVDERYWHSKAVVLSTAVCVTLTTLMVFIVSARIFLRLRNRQIGADDYVMIFSMTRYDPGAPKKTEANVEDTKYARVMPLSAFVSLTRLKLKSRSTSLGDFFYQIGIGGFKVALCVSYLRLVSRTTRTTYGFIIWMVLAITILGHSASTFVVLFNCKPISLSWDPTVPGKCLPSGPMNYSRAGVGIACDVIIMLLPIPLLLTLNIERLQKVGAICLFLLGFFTTLCSVLRLIQIPTLGKGDPTMFVIWSTAEFNVGNVVCSLPYLLPVLKTSLRKFWSSIGRSNFTFGTDNYELSQSTGDPQKLTEPSSNPLRIRQTQRDSEYNIQKTIHFEVSVDIASRTTSNIDRNSGGSPGQTKTNHEIS
ncbi:hypothetical protein N7485_004906 [Penicillium canescens]|nr:hypothetical protein N7485_004906 [Penicillium canescens]